MIEKWDAYDKYFNKIADGSLIRGEVIPDGVYHLVGEIIVKHTDGTYLLMQRAVSYTHLDGFVSHDA